jgi:hypothetical protein
MDRILQFTHSDANNKTSSSSSCRFSGKTRPQTGVVFRDPTEAAETTTQTKLGNVNYELIAPDGSPVFLSFFAPWVSTYFHCSPWISSLCFYQNGIIIHIQSLFRKVLPELNQERYLVDMSRHLYKSLNCQRGSLLTSPKLYLRPCLVLLGSSGTFTDSRCIILGGGAANRHALI